MVSDCPCEFLEWDSAFFSCRIARITAHRLCSPEIQRILTWCTAQCIDCLYFLADPRDAETVRLAEDNQFRLVDLRVTLERCLQIGRELKDADTAPAPIIRPVSPDDIDTLRAIARVSHRDSRFYTDPKLRRAAGALFEKWIDNNCRGQGDAVLVAECARRPVGYVTCQTVTPSCGQIGLIAVAPKWRGKGLGRALVEAALNWFVRGKIERVIVVTQGKNEQALRLYQRCSFLTQSVQLWYHHWLQRKPAQASADSFRLAVR
jgi:GNAT superfamily N-acetyltransferase